MNAPERDLLLGRLDERTLQMVKKLDAHNGDIRALKTWQARLTGAFGVVAFICLVVQDELREAVTHLLGS
ncbi:unnamed protein product [marine sediment metagenome]|uniref:Uncharacterized protein n=1 Tax=marine sediment metagenome TaxID=412755 RepID=X0YU31_9ZZZZ